eukprot:gene14600-20649_t
MARVARFTSCILLLNLFGVFGEDSQIHRFPHSLLDSYPENSWTRKNDGARNLARVYRDINAGKGPADVPDLYLRYKVQMNSSRRYQKDVKVGHRTYGHVYLGHNTQTIENCAIKVGHGTYGHVYLGHDTQTGEKCAIKVGHGTYGHVYLGHDTQTGQKCAIKVTEKRPKWRLLRELMIMNDIQGGPNIVKVMDVVRDRRSHQPVSILEYLNSTLYDAQKRGLKPVEVQLLCYKLISALNFTHSKGYMHRDIKPRNVMVDPATQQLRLVDWDDAERYIPGEMYSTKFMTLPYKAPELLVNLQVGM